MSDILHEGQEVRTSFRCCQEPPVEASLVDKFYAHARLPGAKKRELGFQKNHHNGT
jgi:hypothetical protein